MQGEHQLNIAIILTSQNSAQDCYMVIEYTFFQVQDKMLKGKICPI